MVASVASASEAVGLHSVREAAARIAPYVHRPTPILHSALIDDLCGAAAIFKCEHLQLTGSFKARGALNAVLSLSEKVAAKGVVAHSTGNHGAAVAFAARARGVLCTIVVPTNTPDAKVANIARYGATLVRCAPTTAARTAAAEAAAAGLGGAAIVHPYDDELVIAGQGTIGLELRAQVEGLDAILVPVSGGGMLAGIAAACAGTATRVIAVEPSGKRLGCALAIGVRDGAFALAELAAAPTLSTLADAMPTILLGPKFAWPLVQRWVAPSNVLTVDDEGIARALRLMASELKQAVEPAGAVALAGLLSPGFRELLLQSNKAGRPLCTVAVVVCGGNVDLATLGRILQDVREEGGSSSAAN